MCFGMSHYLIGSEVDTLLKFLSKHQMQWNILNRIFKILDFMSNRILRADMRIRRMHAFTYQTKFILNLSYLIFKLEQWQVEVESTGRKVKRLKSEAIFWYF